MEREEILESACALFLEEGLDGFSMRKLAERLDVTAPALYRHYEGREEVLGGVVGEAYRTLRDVLYRALEEATPEERFRAAGAAYLDFALEHPGYYQMLYAPADALGLAELPDEAVGHALAVGQFWNDRVRDCMDAGLLARRDPREAGVTLWSHAHGLVSLFLLGMVEIGEEGFRRLYRQSSLRVLLGLATEEYRSELARELDAEEAELPETRAGAMRERGAGAAAEVRESDGRGERERAAGA